MTVKRKYKTHNQGRMHWWFVLKAEEETLAVLEKEWNRVALQLSWQLEPCFKPLTLTILQIFPPKLVQCHILLIILLIPLLLSRIHHMLNPLVTTP